MAAPQAPARRDISDQVVRDRDHLNPQDILVARMTAVLKAQEAREEGWRDADYIFRQSLVEDELPAPAVG